MSYLALCLSFSIPKDLINRNPGLVTTSVLLLVEKARVLGLCDPSFVVLNLAPISNSSLMKRLNKRQVGAEWFCYIVLELFFQENWKWSTKQRVTYANITALVRQTGYKIEINGTAESENFAFSTPTKAVKAVKLLKKNRKNQYNFAILESQWFANINKLSVSLMPFSFDFRHLTTDRRS